MKLLFKFAIFVICPLLIASILRIGFGYSQPLTLSDLLDVLSEAPIVDFSSIIGINLTASMGSIESWGIFSFVYPLAYAFATVLDFIVFAFSAVVTALNWLLYFGSWFIGVPLPGV